ncbi:NAD(P)/FAD-dependent oxidoreductase [Mesorhizobium sp. ISC15]|uniref:NAD(P)/FAD-dependent oxidoreductase n=1 Tax=Mesorhizobium sp. ISC15 TaxID=3076429 RepID=UPI00301DB867
MSTASWPAPASLASRLRERWRNAALDNLILEAENAIGTGTSSRNSEVIHAGIYYPAGSQKARLCVAGREQLYRYCEERAVPHARCGKLIVATDAEQEPALASILANASACGAGDLTPLTAAEARALEPKLRCTAAALLSPATGIIDSHALMLALRGDVEEHGGTQPQHPHRLRPHRGWAHRSRHGRQHQRRAL